ncbi:MAG: hypothetical protein AB2A00_23345 [Myxococcota bacterium]
MTPSTPVSPLPVRPSRLQQLQVATPCEADWNQMRGDDRVRHCDLCHLNVYNLSAMTTQDAEALLERTEGRVCVRLYRRKDGTVITQDCPRGLERVRRRMRRLATLVGSALVVLLGAAGLTVHFGRGRAASGELMGKVAPHALMGTPVPVMGEAAVVPAGK